MSIMVVVLIVKNVVIHKKLFEMIVSVSLQCPIEWFHFSCVKLTTKPKGKW